MEWKKQIRPIGTSLGFIIPSELLQHLNLQEGDTIIIQDDKGKHGKFVSFWNLKQKIPEKENLSKMG